MLTTLFFRMEWLAGIPGFPGYWAAMRGRVFSTRSAGRGHGLRLAFLTQRPHPRTGHLRVDLHKPEGTTTRKVTRSVHILVAWAWLGEQPVGTEVCHSNGAEQDNWYVNLYYGTRSENRRDRERHRQDRLRSALEADGQQRTLADYDTTGTAAYIPDPELGF